MRNNEKTIEKSREVGDYLVNYNVELVTYDACPSSGTEANVAIEGLEVVSVTSETVTIERRQHPELSPFFESLENGIADDTDIEDILDDSQEWDEDYDF